MQAEYELPAVQEALAERDAVRTLYDDAVSRCNAAESDRAALAEDVVRLREALEAAADALDAASNEMLGMDRRVSERAKLAADHPDEFPITPSDHGSLGATLWGRGCDAGSAATAARRALAQPVPDQTGSGA